jgi:hypothetical protein
MVKEFSCTTPRDFLIATNLIREKPKVDDDLLRITNNNLPISDIDCLTYLGSGDWARGKSSGGSVVQEVKGSEVVIKYHLGESYQDDSLAEVCNLKKIVDLHSKHSPKRTDFFIAQIDGKDSRPKIITVQTKNNGVPLCDIPFKTLVQKKVVEQIDSIVKLRLKVFIEHSCHDFAGLQFNVDTKLKRKLIYRLIYNLPWFTDNLMMNQDSKVEITDNIPSANTTHFDNKFQQFKNRVKILLPWYILKVSSFCLRFYFNFTDKIKALSKREQTTATI